LHFYMSLFLGIGVSTPGCGGFHGSYPLCSYVGLALFSFIECCIDMFCRMRMEPRQSTEYGIPSGQSLQLPSWAVLTTFGL
jgi:hypothetical protein